MPLQSQPETDRSQRIPTEYLRSALAPAPRTLIDIVIATAEANPDALAIDDGSTTLTYLELLEEMYGGAQRLGEAGVGAGDRVGIRMPSGSYSLYVAILSVLAAGAAYVPVDADDPDERAELVFGEAQVAAIITGDTIEPGTAPRRENPPAPRVPTVDDDAWIIFTSGSTGTPKGVAVSHRSAAAFVDAEARMFLQHAPIGPGDRVLAGLSVAFDASCEEMWLAWRHGATRLLDFRLVLDSLT
ncbi:AMP-binding protein, partial [Rhodococcus sp. NPDC058514]|uniref:AMP-binding protein n=1 Tax=Rhodococcus sp. NPDC058514 TaxID=3346532 RepID=UPI003651EDFD